MATYKKVILKDPITGEYLLPVGYGTGGAIELPDAITNYTNIQQLSAAIWEDLTDGSSAAIKFTQTEMNALKNKLLPNFPVDDAAGCILTMMKIPVDSGGVRGAILFHAMQITNPYVYTSVYHATDETGQSGESSAWVSNYYTNNPQKTSYWS